MNQPRPEKETLSIRIGLSALYWDKTPQYSVAINNQQFITSNLDTRDIVYHQIDYEIELDRDLVLEITLLNKADSDTVQDQDKNIVKDMLLNIESIEIDGIELEQLKWTESVFIPTDKNKPTLDNCVNIGWNGTYKLPMSTPFYLWLLEKM
jgi:hypothetical protein